MDPIHPIRSTSRNSEKLSNDGAEAQSEPPKEEYYNNSSYNRGKPRPATGEVSRRDTYSRVSSPGSVDARVAPIARKQRYNNSPERTPRRNAENVPKRVKMIDQGCQTEKKNANEIDIQCDLIPKPPTTVDKHTQCCNIGTCTGIGLRTSCSYNKLHTTRSSR